MSREATGKIDSTLSKQFPHPTYIVSRTKYRFHVVLITTAQGASIVYTYLRCCAVVELPLALTWDSLLHRDISL